MRNKLTAAIRDYLHIIAKRKRFILVFVFLTSLVMGIITYTQPAGYKATAVLSINTPYITFLSSGKQFSPPKMTTLIGIHKSALRSPEITEKVAAALKKNNPSLSISGENLQISTRHSRVMPTDTNVKLYLEIKNCDPALSQLFVNTWAQEYVYYVNRLHEAAKIVRKISRLGADFTKYGDTLEALSWQIKEKEHFLDTLATEGGRTRSVLYNINNLQAKKAFAVKKQNEVAAEIAMLQKQLQNEKDIISAVLEGESPEVALDGTVPALLQFINENGISLKSFWLYDVTIVSYAQKSKQEGISSKALTIGSFIPLAFILACFLAQSKEH